MPEKGNRTGSGIGAWPVSPDAVEACRRLAREGDFERYLASLFAPRARRPALWTLLAFNAEIARIPALVSEPAIGAIRLHWWRERLEAAAAGGPEAGGEAGPPLAAALGAAVRAGALAPARLMGLIDGRERELDAAPTADVGRLRDRAARTGGLLAEAMAETVSGAAEGAAALPPARALGTGWALTGLLRAARPRAAGGRPVLPPAAPPAAVAAVAALARAELAAAHRTGGPADRLLVLGPVATAWLDRLEHAGFDPAAVPGRLVPAHLLGLMLGARWFGRGLRRRPPAA